MAVMHPMFASEYGYTNKNLLQKPLRHKYLSARFKSELAINSKRETSGPA
jgi:hypothetical protein